MIDRAQRAPTALCAYFFEVVGELNAALSVDGGFESGDALQTPGCVGDGLDEIAFALADGT